jgi:hypothetical protein
MWMSECIIVVDRNNVDLNGLADIAAAIAELGAIVKVDEQRHVIEASVPADEVATVAAMTGVSYVRSVFSYFRGTPPLQTA